MVSGAKSDIHLNAKCSYILILSSLDMGMISHDDAKMLMFKGNTSLACKNNNKRRAVMTTLHLISVLKAFMKVIDFNDNPLIFVVLEAGWVAVSFPPLSRPLCFSPVL